jgi:hypothetical protein
MQQVSLDLAAKELQPEGQKEVHVTKMLLKMQDASME